MQQQLIHSIIPIPLNRTNRAARKHKVKTKSISGSSTVETMHALALDWCCNCAWKFNFVTGRVMHMAHWYIVHEKMELRLYCSTSKIRWRFVVHGCLDGFSRMISHIISCATNNRATTVVSLRATAEFGVSSRVRSDMQGWRKHHGVDHHCSQTRTHATAHADTRIKCQWYSGARPPSTNSTSFYST